MDAGMDTEFTGEELEWLVRMTTRALMLVEINFYTTPEDLVKMQVLLRKLTVMQKKIFP